MFGGRTRKQQLEYIFKCCGSPGQGRWPEGNKAPLYRHLRPVDKDGKSLHFKPRLDKVWELEMCTWASTRLVSRDTWTAV